MDGLIWVATFGTVASLAYYVASSLAGLIFLHRASADAPALPKHPPRVALLKPIYSLNETTLSNLATFFDVDYPAADIIIGVSDSKAESAAALAPLRARHPDKNVVLVSGEEPNCANRKVAKLIRMAEHAQDADVLVLSDADIRVEPDYLRRLMAELDAAPRIGAVTCIYRALANGKFGSRLEALSVNTGFAPLVMLSALVEPMRHAFGATIAIKRRAVDAIGGFRAVKDVLADDFFLGRLAAENGFKIRLSGSLVTIACEERSFSHFWNHQLRWARTYRTARPISVASIIVQGPLWALLLMLATRFSALGVGVFAFVIAARLASAALLLDRVLGTPKLLRDLWLVPIKDLIMAAVWFTSLFGNEVMWAGRRFRILPGGAMREVEG